MNEDFLHYIWKHKKFEFRNLKTTQDQEIILIHTGIHNIDHAGPDFFNARIRIDGQKWAGNVELHKKASDWYVHNHQNDRMYDNVILHVVWEDDIAIYRKDNTLIPVLRLKDYVSKNILKQYKELYSISMNSEILCKEHIFKVSPFVISNWQERLYIERLEQKSKVILDLLKDTSNDWEAVLFKLIAKNFGSTVNGDAFLSIANSFDFTLIRKCNQSPNQIEALLFGQAGLLHNCSATDYERNLKKEYDFLKSKFGLNNFEVLPMQFFRLRPSNFPTIRLAQLAQLYVKNTSLFNVVIQANSLTEIRDVFNISIEGFWNDHYTFDKKSPCKKKKISYSFIDLILINTIIPIKFIYAKSHGQNIAEQVLELVRSLPAEKNSIITKFESLKLSIKDAKSSQAMIQLKKEYCDKRACLQCAIGNYLLNRD